MIRIIVSLSVMLLAGVATPAQAYIGPGAGLGAIGVAIALLFGILLLVVGFVWYPIRRSLRKRKEKALVSSHNDEQKPRQENES